RFLPGDFSEARWSGAPILPGSKSVEKVSGQGTGYFEYHLRLPSPVKIRDISHVSVKAELASSSGSAKLEWAERRNSNDYPQTDNRKWPTDVVIKVNGVRATLGSGREHSSPEVKTLDCAVIQLPDDPADARGAQSHH